MGDELDDILARSRRVYRVTRRTPDAPAVPPGFAERVRRNRDAEPSRQLLIWERAAYAGTACALAVAMLTMWQAKSGPRQSAAPDLWLDMPMEAESPGKEP